MGKLFVWILFLNYSVYQVIACNSGYKVDPKLTQHTENPTINKNGYTHRIPDSAPVFLNDVSMQIVQDWTVPDLTTPTRTEVVERGGGKVKIIKKIYTRTQIVHKWTSIPLGVTHLPETFDNKHLRQWSMSNPPTTTELTNLLTDLNVKVRDDNGRNLLMTREHNSVFNVNAQTMQDAQLARNNLYTDVMKDAGVKLTDARKPSYMQYSREVVVQEGFTEFKEIGKTSQQTKQLTWQQGGGKIVPGETYTGIAKLTWDPTSTFLSSWQELKFDLGQGHLYNLKQTGWSLNADQRPVFKGTGEFTGVMSKNPEKLFGEPFIGTYVDANNNQYHTLEWHFPTEYQKMGDTGDKFVDLNGGNIIKINYNNHAPSSPSCRRKRSLSSHCVRSLGDLNTQNKEKLLAPPSSGTNPRDEANALLADLGLDSTGRHFQSNGNDPYSRSQSSGSDSDGRSRSHSYDDGGSGGAYGDRRSSSGSWAGRHRTKG